MDALTRYISHLMVFECKLLKPHLQTNLMRFSDVSFEVYGIKNNLRFWGLSNLAGKCNDHDTDWKVHLTLMHLKQVLVCFSLKFHWAKVNLVKMKLIGGQLLQ